MRKATKTVAKWFGVTAGLAALEHGYFENLQGNVRPAGVMFPSWGADICNPDQAWHAFEPAMSLLPSFLLSGILTILLSLMVLAWSGWFLQRMQGGLVLILLAIALLLVGGGFFPPVIAFVGGLAIDHLLGVDRRPIPVWLFLQRSSEKYHGIGHAYHSWLAGALCL